MVQSERRKRIENRGIVKDRELSTEMASLITNSPQKYQPWINRKKYTVKDATNRTNIFQVAEKKTSGGLGIVTFVGNNKYCDGALVLGYTAMKTSNCGKGKWCQTGVLVSKKISPHNIERLSVIFNEVVTVNDTLARSVKGTPWGSTFDKFYLWALTRFEFIIFYDADMVLTKHTAAYYHSLSLPSDNHWIAALGTTGGYFATGTVVLRPNITILNELLGFYDAVLKNETDKWGFRGPNARDGLVMRYFIAGRVMPIEGIPGHHFSGAWKPWYNINGDYSEVKDFKKIFKGSPSRIPLHDTWWTACEQMHTTMFMDKDSEQRAFHNEWGDKASPTTHIWMLRDTKWQYLHPLKE